jgi:NTP pyrophosphatase (non-canonical NTP hydrolase)
MSLSFCEVQEWVERFERKRGWADRPPEEKLICLQEEIGELATAIKHVWTRSSEYIKKGIKPEDARKRALGECSTEVAEEIADCIVYLLSIANKFHINMDKSLAEKMKVNDMRKWAAEHTLKTGFK